MMWTVIYKGAVSHQKSMRGNIMLVNRIAYYFNAMFYLLLIPSFPYSKQYIKGLGGKKEEQDSNFWKALRIMFIVIGIIGISWVMIAPTPIVVNGIYSDIEGIVTESRCTSKKNNNICNYGVKIIRTDNGKEWESGVLSDLNVSKGSMLEVRTYKGTLFPDIAIRVNGEETDFYRERQEEFSWEPTLDRIFVAMFVIINVLVHIVQYKMKEKTRSTTRKGILFWRIWNYGCAVFSVAMIVCTWWPISTTVQGYIWGYTLWILFSVYQLAGYAHILESAGFVWNYELSEEEIHQKKMNLYKVKRYESGTLIETQEEVQSTVVQFVPLTYEQAEKYCDYRYKLQEENRDIWILIWEILYIVAGVVVFFFVESKVKWFLRIGILAVITPIYLKKSFIRKDIPVKDAFTGSCEYAILDAIFYEKVRGVCTDGYEIVWELNPDDDAEIKKGEKAAVVYLSAINRVFTEKVDTIHQILEEKEEQWNS